MFDIFSSVRKNHSDEPFQVTRQTVIGDILDLDNSTAPYFMEIGMHCLGCLPSPRREHRGSLRRPRRGLRRPDPEAERSPGRQGQG